LGGWEARNDLSKCKVEGVFLVGFSSFQTPDVGYAVRTLPDSSASEWPVFHRGSTPPAIIWVPALVLLCQIRRKSVMPAGKRASSARDGEL
jgi:hypothetical protein